jgi:hypothetical protein
MLTLGLQILGGEALERRNQVRVGFGVEALNEIGHARIFAPPRLPEKGPAL